MNMTDATLTNGRYELPAHARGVLVLADPPEAGWRLELPPDEEVAPEAEQAGGTPPMVLGSSLPHRARGTLSSGCQASRSHPATGSGRYRRSPENVAPSASGNRSEEGVRSA